MLYRVWLLRSVDLVKAYRTMRKYAHHDNVLILLGDDFRWVDPEEWSLQHENYMQMFDYINNNTNVFKMKVNYICVNHMVPYKFITVYLTVGAVWNTE